MNHAARIEDTIQGIYDAFDHPEKHPADAGITSIDNWIQALDGLGGSALAGIQNELRELRSFVQNDDRANIAASLQRLGEHTSLMARNLHDGTGDQLRHLGQTLVTAAGNLKMS